MPLTLERPLNTYPVGSIIDVPGTLHLGVVIISINDSGVGITSAQYPSGATFSGQSPAIPHAKKEVVINQETGTRSIEIPGFIPRTRKTAEVKNRHFDIPSELFTIKELAANNNVQYFEVLDFIKLCCSIAGEAERTPGQRGKTAKLYKYNE